MTKRLKPHPYCDQLPRMSKQEFESLVTDIRANGQKEPILLFEGKILDGRNRYDACKEAGVEPRTKTFTGSSEEARQLSISNNLVRRHLTASQKAMVLVNSGLVLEAGGRRQYRRGDSSIRSTAERFGVNHVSVYKALFVKQNDKSGELVEEVLKGLKSVAAAEKELRDLVEFDPNGKKESKNMKLLAKKIQDFYDQIARIDDPTLSKVQVLIEKAARELAKINN